MENPRFCSSPMTKYKSVIVTERGGPEVLKVVENDLRVPAAGRGTDQDLSNTCSARTILPSVMGTGHFLVKPPFTPGYSIFGVVDAIGESIASVSVGDRVAALTRLGTR